LGHVPSKRQRVWVEHGTKKKRQFRKRSCTQSDAEMKGVGGVKIKSLRGKAGDRRVFKSKATGNRGTTDRRRGHRSTKISAKWGPKAQETQRR